MRRTASTLVAASLCGIALHGQTDVGPSLDIVGIKVGMTVKEAAVALKADNPRLMLTPTTRPLEGFAQPLLLSIAGQEAPTPGPNGTIARAGETVELLFTTPPSTEVVWGVKRVYNFATSERPDLEITLDALRKKYGLETVAPSPDPRDITKNVAWVYDAQGTPIGPRGAALNTMCAGRFTAYFGDGGNGTLNEVHTGQPGPAECQSIIIVTASVLANRLDPANPQFVVNGLIVQINDGSRHRKATDATRAVALAAAKAREGKEAEEVKKRGAPKL